ncbi:actin-related protein 2/3 complex subunit 2B [Aristolochia californica]|uniref:actin-related protein 2/3 complex subunit 2B n=1 Tax=Aristolochia californica TaxID=171875 RepID=UPI0035D7D223
MACLHRASPALEEILHKLYSKEKPMEIDHNIYEAGSVAYHIKGSASEAQELLLSITTPLLSPEVQPVKDIQHNTLQTIRKAYSNVAAIVEPPRAGFQLTLRLDFSKFPRHKDDSSKLITEIASLQGVILSSQLKDILWNLGSQVPSEGMYRPIKLIHHPKEPFFIIRMPDKIIAVFPMRFKEDSDVILATAFFQELMDVGSSTTWAKAPFCTWSPIPPPELRGEPFNDLSTNAGFVSFDILSQHVEGAKLDKTVWCLLNFPAYVKYHIKCTRSFIQRRMRRRLERLAEVMQKIKVEEDAYGDGDGDKSRKKGRRYVKKLMPISKPMILRRNCSAFKKHLRRIPSPIKIQGFARFRRRWLRIPRFSTLKRCNKLE